MSKRFKPVLALVLSLFMSVSTLSNTYTVFAEDETAVQTDEQTSEDTSTEEGTQEEVNQVIRTWQDGELKTLEEENRCGMEEAGLIEAIHTKSRSMEEEKHEEIVDEDEHEGNDEEETLLNEDEIEEVEEAMKAYLESKRTKDEEESSSSEKEDTEDEDHGLFDDNIVSVKSCITRMTYDDIVNSTDPSIVRGVFIKVGEIKKERADVSLSSVSEQILPKTQQQPSMNIEVKDTASEGEKGVNEEDNINHMEECKDIRTDKGSECNVISGGESRMEEETESVHPTPIIVDTVSQNVKGIEEVKYLNKKNSELGIIGTQCLMTYLLMEAGCSVHLTTGTKGGRKKFTHLPTNLIVTSIKQGNKSCYIRYWDEQKITVSRFSGVEKTREKNIAVGGRAGLHSNIVMSKLVGELYGSSWNVRESNVGTTYEENIKRHQFLGLTLPSTSTDNEAMRISRDEGIKFGLWYSSELKPMKRKGKNVSTKFMSSNPMEAGHNIFTMRKLRSFVNHLRLSHNSHLAASDLFTFCYHMKSLSLE